MLLVPANGRLSVIVGLLTFACFSGAVATLSGQQHDTSAEALLEAGRFREAEPAARLAFDEAVRRDGRHAVTTLDALRVWVLALTANGRSVDARTLDLAQDSVLTPDIDGRARAEEALAGVLVERGEYARAVRAYDSSLSHWGTAGRADDRELIRVQVSAAIALTWLEKFSEADRLLDSALGNRQIVMDGQTQARALFGKAFVRRQQGRYDDARPYAEGALALQRSLTPRHPDVARILQLLGDLAFFAGATFQAEDRWNEAVAHLEEEVGADHPWVAPLLRWRASARLAAGDIETATRDLARARAVAEHRLAECHPESPAIQNDSANVALASGDYPQAQRLYRRALAIVQKCYGARHSFTATVFFNLAMVPTQLGDLAEAEGWLTRAVETWERALGADHVYVARGLDALADVETKRGHTGNARLHYERALRIREARLGSSHPDVAWSLANLARLATASKIREGLERADRAIAIYQAGGTPQDPDHLARALLVRAELLERSARLPDARRDLLDAVEIREHVFGAAHPFVAEARNALAELAFREGNPSLAFAEALRAEQISRDHLVETVRFLPERQAMVYADARVRALDLALSSGGDEPNAPLVLLDALIRSRAVVLDALSERRQRSARLANAPDEDAKLRAARERLATLNARTVLGDELIPLSILDDARRQRDELEAEALEQGRGASSRVFSVQVGLGEVRRVLPLDSALVSFVRFSRRVVMRHGTSKPTSTSVPTMMAFIVRGDSKDVIAIPLGSAAAIERRLSVWSAAIGSDRPLSSTAALAGPLVGQAATRGAGTAVRKLLWDPLTPHLNGVERVFWVPDGQLFSVNLAALPVGSGRYLVETGPTLHMLSSERDLVRSVITNPGSGLLAVGGADYGAPASTSQSSNPCGPDLRFGVLPGTVREVRFIARLWTRVFGESPSSRSTVLTGGAANEQAVRATVSGHRVLHFATHGFFLQEPCRTAEPGARGVGSLVPTAAPRRPNVVARRKVNPLATAGVALAGANRRRSTGSATDGVLTAEEVAELNLEGTEWAVLSACDTGLGVLSPAEGVLGLNRAFQIAGVRTVVMSLWEVSDDFTQQWMQALYRARFEKNISTADAIRAAQVSSLRARRARGQSDSPFYWAAFVAVGDWR